MDNKEKNKAAEKETTLDAAVEETTLDSAAENDAEIEAESDAHKPQAEPETLEDETHEEVKAVVDEEEKTDNPDPLRVTDGVKLAAEPKIDPDKEPNFVCLYIAIAVFALGVVSLALAIGLAFVVPNTGIYFLTGTLIAELAAISFCNAQKKNGQHKLTNVFKALSYAILFAAVIIFALGTSISAFNK